MYPEDQIEIVMGKAACLKIRHFDGLAIGLILFVLTCLNSGCGTVREKGPPPAGASTAPAITAESAGLSQEELQKKMKKYLGIPYRSGGCSLKGTDCSGLIRQMYGSLFGLDLPHNSQALFELPFLTEVSEENLQTGDLLFFSRGKIRIGHVGAYVGDGLFIHASRTSGVILSRLDQPYWRQRFIGSRRLKTM